MPEFDDYDDMCKAIIKYSGYHESDYNKDLCWKLRYLNPVETVLIWIKEMSDEAHGR